MGDPVSVRTLEEIAEEIADKLLELEDVCVDEGGCEHAEEGVATTCSACFVRRCVLIIPAALREAVAQRDAEWCRTIWPENSEGVPAIPPEEAVGLIREGAVLAVKYSVAQERAALREWAKKAICGPMCGHGRHDGIRDVLAWLDAREKSE